MENEEMMILRDLPVDTRNYTIVDNITGKPIDQSTYTMTIDKEVIGKLNKLKQVNEEKVKQAALRDQYGSSSITNPFTPQDNAVFTPVYSDSYISARDFNVEAQQPVVEEVAPVEEETLSFETEAPQHNTTEVIQSDTLLQRVVARDPREKQAAEEAAAKALEEEQQKQELDYISTYVPTGEDYMASNEPVDNAPAADNSLFTPDMVGLDQASQQIVKIDTANLGEDLQRTKEQKKGTEKIRLDKMEILSGKGVAWMAYILFFIPLLFRRNNRFVRLHANEGLELNLMEILSAILVGQYFVLPMFLSKIPELAHTISLVACIIGAGIVGACALTIIPMMIAAMCGAQVQNPWLWKRRMIHVPTERTSDK